MAAMYEVSEARFPPGDKEVATIAGLLWSGLRERSVRKELIVTGRPQGEPQARLIEPAFLTGADPDFIRDTLTGTDGLVFHSVRISEAAAEPVSANPPTSISPTVEPSRGGRPPKYDWSGFQRELSRSLFNGEYLTKREIRQHMTDWCARTWSEQPDERTLRLRMKELLSPEIPEQ